MNKFSVPKSWKNCYVIVRKDNGQLPLIGGYPPIFWSRRVAKDRLAGFRSLTMKKIRVSDLQKFISRG